MLWLLAFLLPYVLLIAGVSPAAAQVTRSGMIQQFEGVYYPLTTTTTPCNDVTLNAAITDMQALPPPRNILQLTPVNGAGAACTWTLNADVTVPRGIMLRIPAGVTVTANSPRVLTLNGPLDAKDPDWFVGTGTLTINYRDPTVDAMSSFIMSGCAPAVPDPGSLTFTAFACRGNITSNSQWFHINQTASAVTVPNSPTIWLALHRNTTDTPSGCGAGNWVRVAGTHYLTCANATQPGDPAGGIVFEQVTVAAGVITAVTEISLRRITGTETVSASRTIGRPATWVVEPSGNISMAGSTTLTMNGELIGPNRQIFSGTGVITFGANSRTLRVTPYWWGGLCDGSNDDSAALTAIFTAANGSPSIVIPGACRTTASLTSADAQTLEGKHRSTSSITLTSATASQNLINAGDRMTIQHLTLQVNGNGQRALVIVNDAEVLIDDVVMTSTVAQDGVGVLCQTTLADGSYSGRIRDSEFTNLAIGTRLGFAADTIGCNAWTISGTKFTSNNTGLLIDEANSVTLIGNRFESNTAIGIDAGTAAGAVCAGVTITGGYFEANTTNHIRAGGLCVGWQIDNILVTGGSFNIADGVALWHSQNQGNPGYVFARDGWGMIANQFNLATVTATGRFNRMLIGSLTVADASNSGLLTITFASNNPDSMSCWLFFNIYSSASATRSTESGMVVASLTHDNSSNLVSAITKVGGTLALDAGMTSYTVSFNWALGSSIATIQVNADANPNDTSVINFTVWCQGGQHANTTMALEGPVTPGQ